MQFGNLTHRQAVQVQKLNTLPERNERVMGKSCPFFHNFNLRKYQKDLDETSYLTVYNKIISNSKLLFVSVKYTW
jgi:urate oxidase